MTNGSLGDGNDNDFGGACDNYRNDNCEDECGDNDVADIDDNYHGGDNYFHNTNDHSYDDDGDKRKTSKTYLCRK